GPSASAEPATPPAGRTGPAHKECLTGALPDRPASGFPPALPAAVDRFRFVAVPRSSAHAASGAPGVHRRSSPLLPDSLYCPSLFAPSRVRLRPSIVLPVLAYPLLRLFGTAVPH